MGKGVQQVIVLFILRTIFLSFLWNVDKVTAPILEHWVFDITKIVLRALEWLKGVK